MGIEVAPSVRSLLVVLGVVLTAILWMYSSGAIVTLVAVGLIIGVALLLLWAGGVRVSRWLTGV